MVSCEPCHAKTPVTQNHYTQWAMWTVSRKNSCQREPLYTHSLLRSHFPVTSSISRNYEEFVICYVVSNNVFQFPGRFIPKSILESESSIPGEDDVWGLAHGCCIKRAAFQHKQPHWMMAWRLYDNKKDLNTYFCVTWFNSSLYTQWTPARRAVMTAVVSFSSFSSWRPYLRWIQILQAKPYADMHGWIHF